MPKSRTVLLVWLTLYAAFGVASGLLGKSFSESSAFDVSLGALTAALIYVWCRAEVLERGVIAPRYSALFAAVFAPIGLPLHFYRSRKPRVLVATLKAVGFYVGAFIVLATSEAVAHVAGT